MTANTQSQADKFKGAARPLECDDDEQRFRQRVGKLETQAGAGEAGHRRLR
jgi:hypothetical protein